ncbi:hypothetical protein [Nocardioides sp. zg-1228]|uniref:hypothetical protein n=1 Tax=Nocardioides sp. zg-1228 TaxID=2763008 RepID=UPI001642DE05|nr:hypothetical protein [Nocardioides sp. zg-1228]MBC2932205.1 hypothetical protein [Nocardioides sp. zg-1228]QSF57737.1 hypothetical protein JX575_00365 [Nocardioides sp. zg-1228]
MESPPGASPPATVLTPRPLVLHLAIGVLVVGILLASATWAGGGDQRALLTVAILVVTVALPAWAIWWARGRTILVRPDRVVVRRGEREVRTFAFDDLTEVRPGVDGSAGGATPELWNKSVTLLGRTTAGRRRGLKVTAQTVESIDPLLLALAPVVARRPELLPHAVHRALFEEYVRDLRSGRGRQRG